MYMPGCDKWDRMINTFYGEINKYMPDYGQGETMASQCCTAVNKLIYKWFNDGDVYDNTHGMPGWCNDISSYANWLFENLDGSRDILERIADCRSDDDYERLLWDLAERLIVPEDLEALNGLGKCGSIYDCDGPYEFREKDEEEDPWEC